MERPSTKMRMPAATAPSGRSLTGAPLRLRDRDARLAGHPGAAEAAVAVWILRQVLLVVILRVIELGRRHDFGGDPAVAGLRQRALIVVARALRGGALRLVEYVDPRS